MAIFTSRSTAPRGAWLLLALETRRRREGEQLALDPVDVLEPVTSQPETAVGGTIEAHPESEAQ